MGDRRNIFSLSQENIKFLRIFQLVGVLPVKLMENERNFAKISSHILSIILVFLMILKFSMNVTQIFLVFLFGYEICLIFFGQLSNFFSVKKYKQLFEAFGEVDERLKHVLNKKKALMKANVKLQRVFVIVSTFYSLGALYFPSEKHFQQVLHQISSIHFLYSSLGHFLRILIF